MERPNIQLPVEFGTTSAYSRPNGGGSEEKYVPRNRAAHAARLLSQIDKAIKEAGLAMPRRVFLLVDFISSLILPKTPNLPSTVSRTNAKVSGF